MKIIQFNKASIQRANTKLDMLHAGADASVLKPNNKLTLESFLHAVHEVLKDFYDSGDFKVYWKPHVLISHDNKIELIWLYTDGSNTFEFRFSDELMSIASTTANCITFISNERPAHRLHNFILTNNATGDELLQSDIGYLSINMLDDPASQLNTLKQGELMTVFMDAIFRAQKQVIQFWNENSSKIKILSKGDDE